MLCAFIISAVRCAVFIGHAPPSFSRPRLSFAACRPPSAAMLLSLSLKSAIRRRCCIDDVSETASTGATASTTASTRASASTWASTTASTRSSSTKNVHFNDVPDVSPVSVRSLLDYGDELHISLAIDDGDVLSAADSAAAIGDDLPLTIGRPKRRYRKAWYLLPGSDSDSWEELSDEDVIDRRIMDRGDRLVIAHRDFAAFKKLSSHLGGLHIDIYRYEELFGAITSTSPFGDKVWHGMRQLAIDYPFGSTICGTVGWLGYFFSPMLFSKSTAKAPTSGSAPSRAWLTENSYPAVFYLSTDQHRYVCEAIAFGRGCGKTPADMDFFEQLNLDGQSKMTDCQKGSDPWTSAGRFVIPFDASEFRGVDMTCLNLLLAGCRPWTVDASRMRLFKPVSRL